MSIRQPAPRRLPPIFVARILRFPTLQLGLLGLPLLLQTPRASADTYYWDGNGTSWNNRLAWSTVFNDVSPDPAAPPGAAQIAQFNIITATQSVTPHLDADQAVQGLIFSSPGTVTLANTAGQSHTLTLGASGVGIGTDAGAMTLHENMPVILSASQSWTNNSSFTFTCNGSISGTGALTIGGSGNTSLGASPSGSLGGGISNLIKSGTGTLTLNGNGGNTFTGGVIINAGTLALGAGALNSITPTPITFGPGSTGTLTLNGLNYILGALSTDANVGTPVVQNGSATNLTLGLNSSTNSTFAGTLKDGGTGTLAINKLGSGTLTLSGNNTFTGGVTILSGALKLGSTAALNPASPNSITFFANSAGSFILDGNSVTLSGLNTAVNPGASTVSNGGALAATITINNAVANTLAGTFQNGGTEALGFTKNGAGDFTFSGTTNYSGVTNLNQGILIFTSSASHAAALIIGSGSLRVNTGATLLSDAVNISSLTVNGTYTIRNNAFGNAATSLTILGSPDNWNGKLDLNNSNFVITGAGATNVPNQLKQGANLGAWNGSGITSGRAHAAATGGGSTATALAYATGSQFTANNGHTNLQGQSFIPTDMLIMYTLAGDANMDTSVTFADFLQLQNHYNQPSTDWQGGDFNYDGATTFADFLILQNNYNKTLTAANVLEASPATSVPEPTSLLLLLTSFLLLSRRHPSPSKPET